MRWLCHNINTQFTKSAFCDKKLLPRPSRRVSIPLMMSRASDCFFNHISRSSFSSCVETALNCFAISQSDTDATEWETDTRYLYSCCECFCIIPYRKYRSCFPQKFNRFALIHFEKYNYFLSICYYCIRIKLLFARQNAHVWMPARTKHAFRHYAWKLNMRSLSFITQKNPCAVVLASVTWHENCSVYCIYLCWLCTGIISMMKTCFCVSTT